jgi:hypothetical protein
MSDLEELVAVAILGGSLILLAFRRAFLADDDFGGSG